MDNSVEKVFVAILKVLKDMKESFGSHFKSTVDKELYISAASILDSQKYVAESIPDLLSHINVIVSHFDDLLTANDCDKTMFTDEFRILHSHIT